MNHTLHLPMRRMPLGRCGDKNRELWHNQY